MKVQNRDHIIEYTSSQGRLLSVHFSPTDPAVHKTDDSISYSSREGRHPQM